MNKSQFDKFRRKLDAVVNERANRIANEISGEIVKVFVKRAKSRLEKASDDMVGESAGIIKTLSDNITYETQPYYQIGKTTKKPEMVNRSYVRVKRDSQNLIMFLEYGTGLVGESNRHPEADKIGWNYATNRDNYKRLTRSNTGEGWFFTRKPSSIILKEDIPIHSYLVNERIVKHQVITVKKGKMAGKTYERHQPYNKKTKSSKSIFTQGIKPVRFIYKTKQELKNLFLASKGATTVEEFYNKLNKLEKK